MQAYRIETTIITDGELTLHELPIRAGEQVEVIILAREATNGVSVNHNGITNSTKKSSANKRRLRLEALDRISSGKYAGATESGLLASEEFALRKAQEKALEERRWRS